MSQLSQASQYRTNSKYTSIKINSNKNNDYYDFANNEDMQNFSKDELIYLLERIEKNNSDLTKELNAQKNDAEIKYQTLQDRNSVLTITNASLNKELIFFKTAFIITLLLYVITFISVGCIFAYKKIVAKVRKATIEELTSQNKESLWNN